MPIASNGPSIANQYCNRNLVVETDAQIIRGMPNNSDVQSNTDRSVVSDVAEAERSIPINKANTT